jgi:hypothetical protein
MMQWYDAFLLILPIAGIALLVKRLRRYGAGQVLNLDPSIQSNDSAPVSRHVDDPEHPGDKDWANSEPDPNAP